MRQGKTAKKSIFVVDDSPDLRQLASLLYKREGFDVHVAADGIEALTKLRALAEKPGLILLDLQLSQMSGAQFLQNKLADPELAEIPVVLVSGRSGLPELTKQLRAQGYISKPVAVDTYLKVALKFCSTPEVDPQPGKCEYSVDLDC